MICPTDHIESVIRHRFDGHKFFYTSLANSISIDNATFDQIADLIEKHCISQITFILSIDNPIILDAISDRNFNNISGLENNYELINLQHTQATQSWNTYDQHTMMLSSYLNQKIKILRLGLADRMQHSIKINAKLYSSNYDSFRDILSPFISIYPTHQN